jgi:hypothetical protein
MVGSQDHEAVCGREFAYRQRRENGLRVERVTPSERLPMLAEDVSVPGSAMSRIIRSSWASRFFSETRRSIAWSSPSLGSASTPSLLLLSTSIPSSALGSPTMGSGTSVCQAAPAGRRALNRASRRRCPGSRAGSSAGYARIESCSPTAAHASASCSTETSWSSLRSIRPNVDWCSPTDADAVAMLSPLPRRVRRSRRRSFARIAPACRPALTSRSSDLPTAT